MLRQSIIGAGSEYSGQVIFEGKPIHIHNTTQAVNSAIGYLPRNRKENAIIKDMNILENGSIVTWPRFARFGFIDRNEQNQTFDEQVKSLQIKMGNKSDSINSLSGGNQQKVVLAKWLAAQPRPDFEKAGARY